MDAGFWAGTAFMLLGGYLAVFFRAVNHARSAFSLMFWLKDNKVRFALITSALLVLRILLSFEGMAIVESLKVIGVAVPAIANSVIGFGVTYFIMMIQMQVKASKP